MEETTIFLAGLWGPAILAVGIGFFVSREHYLRIYRDIQREPLALLMFGMAGIAVAILHITAHNTWDTGLEMIISFLGWALLLKAVVMTIMPNFTDKFGDKVSTNSTMLTIIGLVMVGVGAYLTYAAYMI